MPGNDADYDDREWDGGDGTYDDDDDEEGDIDAAEAEAEEIARRLGDQLWASINKAQAEGAAAFHAPPLGPTLPPPTTVSSKRRARFIRNETVSRLSLASGIKGT